MPSKCHLIQYLQTSSRSTIIHHPSSMGLEVPWPSLAPCSTASRGLSCSSPAPLLESKKTHKIYQIVFPIINSDFPYSYRVICIMKNQQVKFLGFKYSKMNMHCTLHWDIRKYHYFEDLTQLNSIDNQETNTHSTIWRSPKKGPHKSSLNYSSMKPFLVLKPMVLGSSIVRNSHVSDWTNIHHFWPATMDAAPSRVGRPWRASQVGKHGNHSWNISCNHPGNTVYLLGVKKYRLYIYKCFCIIWHYYLCIIDYIWYIIYTIHTHIYIIAENLSPLGWSKANTLTMTQPVIWLRHLSKILRLTKI